MSNVEIREAVSADCKAVADLIKELAEYEKLPEQARLTEKALLEDGFGDHKFFHAFVAELNDPKKPEQKGNVIGFALYFYMYSTWEGRSAQLEDLFVKPLHRNKGIGRQLFNAVVKTVRSKKCTRLQMNVLNWNTPTIAIYKHYGATDMTEKEGWHMFRITQEKLDKMITP